MDKCSQKHQKPPLLTHHLGQPASASPEKTSRYFHNQEGTGAAQKNVKQRKMELHYDNFPSTAAEAIIISQLTSFSADKKIDPQYLKTLQSIIKFQKKQISDIPIDNLKSMLMALDFSEVSIEDKNFNEFNIVLIKTGVVFFTWIALRNTTVFDGQNNCAKLNYVTDIIKASEKLKESNKPVFFIYSNAGMSDQLVEETEALFRDAKNIICLCCERDLKNIIKEKFELTLACNDRIRIEVLKHQKEVLEKGLELSLNTEETDTASYIKSCRDSAFVYTDMDNEIIHLPEYVLAFDGVIDACVFSDIYDCNAILTKNRFFNEIIKLHKTDMGFNEKRKEISEEILKHLVDWTNKQSKTEKTTYIVNELDDEFKAKFIEFINLLAEERQSCKRNYFNYARSHSFQDTYDDIKKQESSAKKPFFHGDNGFIITSSPDNEQFTTLYNKKECTQFQFHSEDHQYERGSLKIKNTHYIKANRLTGYQLCDAIIIGADGSWCEHRNNEDSFGRLRIQVDFNVNATIVWRSKDCSKKRYIFKYNHPPAAPDTYTSMDVLD